jgi:hypothetical protein
MTGPSKRANWRAYTGVSLTVCVAVTVIAAITQVWVLTAIPIGFVFGFLLQKGDLCGASAFSEILLLKSGRKVWGLWVWIVVGMVGLGILELLGWAKLAPKSFVWINYLAGGLVFGAGSVLAGGCVSGSLFKTGVGHLSSMVALLGIALGVAAVEHGPLSALRLHCERAYLIKAANGGPLTLSSLTGLPFWALALGFAVLTGAAALLWRRRTRNAVPGVTAGADRRSWSRVFAKSWKPWHAGVALGVLTAISLLSSAASGRNYPLGVTHGVLHTQLLLTDSNLKHVWRKATPPPSPAVPVAVASQPAPASQSRAAATAAKPRPVVWWLIAEILSLIMGASVAARMSGEARLYPKPPEQIVVAILGGLMVGAGAAFAGGCFIGNMTTGWALMSIGTVVFGVAAIAGNLAATYFYIMGGTLFGADE